jgi:hypothetical protein
VLTPGEKGMKGALAKAAEILAASEGKGYIMRVINRECLSYAIQCA